MRRNDMTTESKRMTTLTPCSSSAGAPGSSVHEDQQQRAVSPNPSTTLSSATRWSETIRSVLRGGEAPIGDTDLIPDPVGEHMVRLMNANPAFRTSRQQQQQQQPKETNDVDDDDEFHALLSRHNLKLFSRALGRLLQQVGTVLVTTKPHQIPPAVKRTFRSICNFVVRDQPTLKRTARTFALLLFGSLTFLSIMTQWVILWILRRVLLYGSFLLSLLVDLDELKSLLSPLSPAWDMIVGSAQWIDDTLLQRGRIAGREWNEESFLWRGEVATALAINSRQGKPLLQCPPPCFKQDGDGYQDIAHVVADEWSPESTRHVVALNFCYTMIRDEYLRKQRKKERQQRKEKQQQRRSSLSKRNIMAMQEKEEQLLANSSSPRATFAISKTSCKSDLYLTPKRGSLSLSHTDYENNDEQDQGRLVKCASAEERVRTRRMIHTRSSFEAIEVFDRSRHSEDESSKIVRKQTPDMLEEESYIESEFELEGDGSTSLSSVNSNTDTMDDSITTPRLFSRHDSSGLNSLHSLESDAGGRDMNWLDVGTRIGIRLLNSAHVQKAIASQDTQERIMDISMTIAQQQQGGTPGQPPLDDSFLDANMGSLASLGIGPNAETATDITTWTAPEHRRTICSPPPIRPVHPMWTTPTATTAFSGRSVSSTSVSDLDDSSIASDGTPPQTTPARPMHRKTIVEGCELPPRTPTAANQLEHETETRENRRNYDNDDYVGNQNGTPDGHSWLLAAPTEEARMLKDDSRTDRSSPQPAKETDQRRPLTFTPQKGDGYRHGERRDEPEAESGKSRYVSTPPSSAKRSPLSPSVGQSAPPRPLLAAGVKVVVPMFPIQSVPRGVRRRRMKAPDKHFQMATVVSSKRIFMRTQDFRYIDRRRRHTNCLSVTVKLDRSFLRDGEFAEMTFRVMDEWSARYMPRHSKFPIGACVATSYGIGVLVGWRVEDDCHVVRSLWQHGGDGRARAYLNRDAIHGVVEAAVGFDVETKLGSGKVLAYVNGGKEFRSGRYFVLLKDEGRHKGHVLEFNRTDILSCRGAQFIPIIEYIREAAQYQMQVEIYELAVKQRKLELNEKENSQATLWRTWSKGFDIIWSSFLKAIEEDSDFDDGMSAFVSSIIKFLERLDNPETQSEEGQSISDDKALPVTDTGCENGSVTTAPSEGGQSQGLWILDGIFGGIFNKKKKSNDGQEDDAGSVNTAVTDGTTKTAGSNTVTGADVVDSKPYRRAFAVIHALMRTVSIARASSVDKPNFRLGLSICYEFLLFIRTVVKVQQRNVSPASIAIWKRAISEIVATFGPAKERIEKIGRGIAERMERQGNRAKVRTIRFFDIILLDGLLLEALERGEWDQCIMRLERAFVKARVIDPESREHYHRCTMFLLDHLAPAAATSNGAAARNSAKLARLAKALKWMASPCRSILNLLRRDDFLELLERILVRVFRHERMASRMLTIHASNFQSFRHLRMLKDFTIAGKLWIPLIDAADEEFAWAVSRMPDSAKDLMVPLSKLFSLCVARFHRLGAGDLTADWLDFLMEDDAVKLIHEIDTKLILALEAFCHDIQEVMLVLPYYSSIDDDILNLMDDVDLDEFLREASEAIVDQDRLTEFLREKSTIAIERFLDYLPKMSIPVEQRDLGEGWAITCRGEHGGDLTLSDVVIRRENLMCKIMGGENIFYPVFGENDSRCSFETDSVGSSMESTEHAPSSVLDHIRELLEHAQNNGCWLPGVGGVGQPPSDPYAACVLGDLPVSKVLDCGIELWRNVEIDDDELMEIAIKDVSYQIQLQKEREEGVGTLALSPSNEEALESPASEVTSDVTPVKRGKAPRARGSPEHPALRFNPRKDPTVLFLEMKRLTLNLDRFKFRIEKVEGKTIFDPVFQGIGSLSVQNVSIKLRVECRKERINKLGNILTVPILQLQELDVRLVKVKFKVKDTGADWIVNKIVKGFSDPITNVVEANLKEQVQEQVKNALENLNSYFEVNPDLLLSVLGITMDDLEENVVWV